MKKPRKFSKPKPRPDATFSFALTKRQVADIETQIPLDVDLLAGGTKRGDGSFQYEWTLDKIEDAMEFLAAACNHAENPKIEARLDTIYRKLEKLIE